MPLHTSYTILDSHQQGVSTCFPRASPAMYAVQNLNFYYFGRCEMYVSEVLMFMSFIMSEFEHFFHTLKDYL